ASGQTFTTVTDAQGRAVGRGLRPNQIQGRYQIHVTASKDGQTANADIAMTNVVAAGAAAGAAGSGKLIAILVVGGGAVAGGVLGVPGASLIGDPMASDVDLAAAAIAPGQDLAIASTADGGLHVFRLSHGSLRERTVDGVSIVPERVVFSPSGTAAALYAAGKA